MHLNESEAGELLSHLKAKSLRDYAIVNLILRTGLRTIEVIRADIGDIKHKRGRRILKVWGKGFDDKDNLVILGDATWNPIQEYLNSRGKAKKDEPLFITDGKGHRGARMSTRSVQYVCKEAMKAIGLEGHEYSAHSLRHTTAVLILKNGGDWQDVQRVLRHASPSTSQIYTATIEEEVRLDRNPEGILDNVI
jgi:integrase/recombinase XerC/integrase/recombinase XerD